MRGAGQSPVVDAPPLLPAWVSAPFDDLFEQRLGKMLDQQKNAGDLRPYIRNANVRWFQFDLRDVKLMRINAKELADVSLRAGDLVVCEGGEPGRAAVWHGPSDAFALQKACHRLRARGSVSAAFYAYFLAAEASSGRLARVFTGTTIKHLTGVRLRELRAPLPPANEQRRIVAAIETQFSRLDAAVATLKGVQLKLKRARASVLQAAVEGRLVPTEAALARAEGRPYEPASVLLERILAERRARWPKGKKYKPPVEPDLGELPALPDGWVCVAVEQILDTPLINGRSVATRDGGFPVLRLSALEHGTLLPDQRKGGAWTPEQARAFLVTNGDFLIARGNGSIDRVGAGALVRLQPSPVAFPDTMIRLRFDRSGILPEFGALIWQTPLLRRQIQQSARTTAGIYKINQNSVGRYAIPLPPLAEQVRIVAEVERRLSVLDTLERTVEQNLARCGRLRQSILKRAFEGRLVPQDPNDEPASLLLARLRTERAQTGAHA